MGNNRKLICALFALMASGLAYAESTSDALTRIEAETMLLKAREKQLDVQANILSKQNEIAIRRDVAGNLPQLPLHSDLVLRGIEGLGTALYATVETGGGTFDVQRGDILPNGMRVISIGLNGVSLRDASGRNVHLVVIEQSRSGTAQNTATGASALPLLPPLAPSAPMRMAR